MSEKIRSAIEISKENIGKINMDICLKVTKIIDPKLTVELDKHIFIITIGSGDEAKKTVCKNSQVPDEISILAGKSKVCSF